MRALPLFQISNLKFEIRPFHQPSTTNPFKQLSTINLRNSVKDACEAGPRAANGFRPQAPSERHDHEPHDAHPSFFH